MGKQKEAIERVEAWLRCWDQLGPNIGNEHIHTAGAGGEVRTLYRGDLVTVLEAAKGR